MGSCWTAPYRTPGIHPKENWFFREPSKTLKNSQQNKILQIKPRAADPPHTVGAQIQNSKNQNQISKIQMQNGWKIEMDYLNQSFSRNILKNQKVSGPSTHGPLKNLRGLGLFPQQILKNQEVVLLKHLRGPGLGDLRTLGTNTAERTQPYCWGAKSSCLQSRAPFTLKTKLHETSQNAAPYCVQESIALSPWPFPWHRRNENWCPETGLTDGRSRAFLLILLPQLPLFRFLCHAPKLNALCMRHQAVPW